MTTDWTKERVLARVREMLVEYFEVAPEAVELTAHLIDDLDLDSIDAIDLAVGLEEDTGLKLSDDELKSIRLVQDVVDIVYAKLAGA